MFVRYSPAFLPFGSASAILPLIDLVCHFEADVWVPNLVYLELLLD